MARLEECHTSAQEPPRAARTTRPMCSSRGQLHCTQSPRRTSLRAPRRMRPWRTMSSAAAFRSAWLMLPPPLLRQLLACGVVFRGELGGVLLRGPARDMRRELQVSNGHPWLPHCSRPMLDTAAGACGAPGTYPTPLAGFPLFAELHHVVAVCACQGWRAWACWRPVKSDRRRDVLATCRGDHLAPQAHRPYRLLSACALAHRLQGQLALQLGALLLERGLGLRRRDIARPSAEAHQEDAEKGALHNPGVLIEALLRQRLRGRDVLGLLSSKRLRGDPGDIAEPRAEHEIAGERPVVSAT